MMLGILVIPVFYVGRSIYFRESKNDPRLAYIKLITLVSILAYDTIINTSAPLNDRMVGVLMGFLVGLAYWRTKPTRA
jgi:hypothetical protein